MWRLSSKTSCAWVERIARHPLELLADHAHCELRAASSAQTLIARHASDSALVIALCAVAREELDHFAQVMALLRARGGNLSPAKPNPYAEGLLALRGHRQSELLLDRLLVSALIEARSLERFVLLSEELPDAELAAFYRSLVPSEAGHRALFVELALERFPRARVLERLNELCASEAELLERLAFEPRMHSGLAGGEAHPAAGPAATSARA